MTFLTQIVEGRHFIEWVLPRLTSGLSRSEGSWKRAGLSAWEVAEQRRPQCQRRPCLITHLDASSEREKLIPALGSKARSNTATRVRSTWVLLSCQGGHQGRRDTGLGWCLVLFTEILIPSYKRKFQARLKFQSLLFNTHV